MDKNGTPAWTLHDPPSNKFYLIEWPAFEILSRWNLGTVQNIVVSVNQETTLEICEQDVLGMISFLEHNFLLYTSTPEGNKRLAAAQAAQRPTWAAWLLKNYLFIRIPIIRPAQFLKKTAPIVALLYTKTFFFLTMVVAAIAMYLISRQWDIFSHSFTAYRSIEGIIIVSCAIPIAKIIHEFGHAFTAHRYGCRIPTIGFAFVVLLPMLYTDTNEAWKLTSHTKRLAISVAGIAAEMLLALAALWTWILLDEGPMRSVAFILATSTWIMTIALNISPFMRFDGYFILCDLVQIPNLHHRSSAFGRWWLREWLFGFGNSAPEPTSTRRKVFLVLFALMTWIYRFIVFLAIAIVVYHYFFKALGIFLFVVEIGVFIILPMFKEIFAWWGLRDKMRININTVRSLLIVVGIAYLLVIPWEKSFSAPATLSAFREQQISAPFASIITTEFAQDMQKVRGGEKLLQLSSPEMEQQILQVSTSSEISRWQVDQQTFDQNLLNLGNVPQRRLEADIAELAGLNKVLDQLTVRAPFDGIVVSRNDELTTGLWLSKKEPLYIVADTSMNRVDGYVKEQELDRIRVGAAARFIPDALEFGVYECTVTEIDRVNIAIIDEPFLASTYGGSITAHNNEQGVATPDSPIFRIRMGNCFPNESPIIKLRGVVHIEAEKRSKFVEIIKKYYALAIREIGF
ncbi:efflux RND transporter periplasmic adaptor subunit [Desulforhopalus vacuolatus]|uniref:efflux RND transporter periplasmic adaptor subunit n=1 Tax=Desulforhopalus vacuolatus TaxID=40414 RepID=UPI0019660954|nr:efflux RND transporter periplasmic adaptor subunit [Desulforhopalus vacuolatus]MBM9519858.1 efflux RND transporter periplasmic adaptor subunit [Desulforhopalus vacuolatus]